MLPHALGQKLAFREGEGPVLERIEDHAGIARLDASSAMSKLEPVLETVRRVRAALGPQTALIGFAGSPWTVAAYMVEGGSSRDFRRVKSWAYRDENGFGALIELLVESHDRLSRQSDRSGGRSRTAVRQLGGGAPGARIRALGDRADKAHRCRR